MATKPALAPPTDATSDSTISRRGFFVKLGILFNGLAATVVAIPILGFLFSSITRGRANGYLSWVPLGKVSEFPEGETRLATFQNPYVMPLAGCGASRENNSRSLPSTARIWAARSDGFSNLVCSCVLVTAERTTEMARVLPVHRNAVFLNIHTKLRTA